MGRSISQDKWQGQGSTAACICRGEIVTYMKQQFLRPGKLVKVGCSLVQVSHRSLLPLCSHTAYLMSPNNQATHLDPVLGPYSTLDLQNPLATDRLDLTCMYLLQTTASTVPCGILTCNDYALVTTA